MTWFRFAVAALAWVLLLASCAKAGDDIARRRGAPAGMAIASAIIAVLAIVRIWWWVA